MNVIFKVEEIKVGEPRRFWFPPNSRVTINHFQLKKDQAVEAEVIKHKDTPDTIFITLYDLVKDGIGTVVSREPYIINSEVIESVNCYDIRSLKEKLLKSIRIKFKRNLKTILPKPT